MLARMRGTSRHFQAMHPADRLCVSSKYTTSIQWQYKWQTQYSTHLLTQNISRPMSRMSGRQYKDTNLFQLLIQQIRIWIYYLASKNWVQTTFTEVCSLLFRMHVQQSTNLLSVVYLESVILWCNLEVLFPRSVIYKSGVHFFLWWSYVRSRVYSDCI